MSAWAIDALKACAERLRTARRRAEDDAADYINGSMYNRDMYPYLAGSMTGACDAAAADIEAILKALEAGNGHLTH